MASSSHERDASDNQPTAVPAKFNKLGHEHLTRFRSLGELSDLNEAVACHDQAVQLTPDDHKDKPIFLKNLGESYTARFENLGEVSDIDKAIACLAQAIQLTSDDDADKPVILNNLGDSYGCRFKRLAQPPDIDKAIDCYTQAMHLTSEGHRDMLEALGSLGVCHLFRSIRFGELSDIEQGIAYLSRAVHLAPDDYLDRPALLLHLGSSYRHRFEQFGELPDINKSVTYLSQAEQLMPDGYGYKPSLLDSLGTSYLRLFERLGELSDIDKALAYHSQVVQMVPDNHSDKPVSLNNLGVSYISRFNTLGELPDLDNAIAYQLQAVQRAPDDHSEKPGFLNSLGWSYANRFERLGEISDINQAVAYQTQAVQLAPDGYPGKPLFLSNLGLSYTFRYQSLGERPDVDKAVDCLIQAVQRTPTGLADRPKFLGSLGLAYTRRFEQFSELPDVENAIACLSEAVQLIPEDHALKSILLNNLGLSHTRRFEHLGELANVEKAIACFSQTVQLTPDSHILMALFLQNLATACACRFQRLNELSDIDKAIASQIRALELTPDGHANKPMVMSELGHFYFFRAERLGELSDFDKAVAHQSEAVQLSPDDHAKKSMFLISLGRSCLSRFHLKGERSDLEIANNTFRESALFAIGHPMIRFGAARDWAESSSLLGFSPEPAYQRAMALVDQFVWLGTPINQRCESLAKISDLTMEAAASAIADEDLDRALECLEQGRSVVWNQILQLRTPFDSASSTDQVLAQRLKDVGSELERAGSRRMSIPLTSGHVADLEQEAQNHRRLATEWDQLLEQVRSTDGFENFLRPPKAEALIRAAKDGPIILINIDSNRCDALVLLLNIDNVAHVPLPKFSLEKAVDARAQLESLVGQRSPRTRWVRLVKHDPNPKDKFKQMLKTLWLDVVKPVLDFLGYTQKTPAGSLPHVTWCTTGTLSFLPLHAAGCYDGSQENAFDLVVSSYIPTLSALLSSNIPNCGSQLGILAVGQEHTEGLSALPNTRKELTVVEEHAKGISHLLLDDEKATVDAVLNAMDEYSWVHLACHASQNPSDPSKSAFHLHDGSLMLSAITKRSFKNKGLAFLSACQTAAGDEKVPDEAVHLAAGMLMAGYPSVIATMWVIADEDAPEISREVYAELIKDRKMDCSGASRALHKAVAGLREKVGEEAFERWVPFMHIGR